MRTPADFDPLLIDRYLAGHASDADREAVAAWLAADPRNAAMLSVIEVHVAVDPAGKAPLSAAESLARTEQSWQRLATRLAADPSASPAFAGADIVSLDDHRARRLAQPAEQPARRPSPLLRSLARLAATIVVVVGGTALWQRAHPTLVEASAPAGQRRTVTLADGSTVTLAAGSRLQWRDDFTRGPRDVVLTGEAYFDVRHDASRPFRVRARGGIAEDIGTRFVVRAWPELPMLDVVVEEGAVALSDSTARAPRTTLRAGDRGRLSATGAVSVSHDTEGALAWMHGELVFADTPLPEALASLSRWYAADLQADPSLSARRLTARFASRPLPDLLEALGLALDVRIERAGQVITLRPTH